jgi:tetraacyldisaccharide 4'-kinase
MDKRLFLMNVNAQSHQTVYFTSLKYGSLQPVFSARNTTIKADLVNKDTTALLVTGIANPLLLIKEITPKFKEVITISYPDHYTFKQADINSIIEKYNKIQGNKIIITTEKDAARLTTFDAPENMADAWFYIPIEIEFLSNDAEHFIQQILHYVNNNSKNSILYKK